MRRTENPVLMHVCRCCVCVCMWKQCENISTFAILFDKVSLFHSLLANAFEMKLFKIKMPEKMFKYYWRVAAALNVLSIEICIRIISCLEYNLQVKIVLNLLVSIAKFAFSCHSIIICVERKWRKRKRTRKRNGALCWSSLFFPSCVLAYESL